MWLVYGLLVILVITFHVALFFVVKAGLQQSRVPESPSAKHRPRHYPVGFHTPLQSPFR